MRERLRNAISKFPGYSVTFAALIGFLLATMLQVLQLNSEIEKFYRKPAVNFSITWPDAYAIIVDVPASKIKRLPSADNDFMIKWMAIPVRAELINSTSSPVSFRNLELTFLVKEREGLRPCEDPDYYNDEQYKKKGIHGGFYTWIVKNRDINPNEDINVPITIGANQTRVIEIDFLTVPLIPETVASATRTDMNSFNAFCMRWVDQAGTKYVSNTYYPLDYSPSASNKSLQGTPQKAARP
jgi:hypothetical protein